MIHVSVVGTLHTVGGRAELTTGYTLLHAYVNLLVTQDVLPSERELALPSVRRLFGLPTTGPSGLAGMRGRRDNTVWLDGLSTTDMAYFEHLFKQSQDALNAGTWSSAEYKFDVFANSGCFLLKGCFVRGLTPSSGVVTLCVDSPEGKIPQGRSLDPDSIHALQRQYG